MTASVTLSPELLGGVVGELAQHLRADLLRRVQLVAHLEAGRPAVALDDVEATALASSEISSKCRPMNRLAE